MFDKTGESGEPWGGSLLARHLHAVHHDPGFQIPADQFQDPAVTDLARDPCHQDVMLDAVEEPVQIKVHDPPVTVLDGPPRDPDRLMSGPAGTEPEGRPRELRVEDGHEYLRDGLLDQAVQHPRHPQHPLAATRLRDDHLTDRRRPVGARVEFGPHSGPVDPQPRTEFRRGHAVHTGSTPVRLDTSKRRKQVLLGEHPLPQRQVLFTVNDLLGARRPVTTL